MKYLEKTTITTPEGRVIVVQVTEIDRNLVRIGIQAEREVVISRDRKPATAQKEIV